ncbi:MAG: hypothetical protein R3C69_04080 [Geminicoccaceae bacterium]
MVRQPNSTSRWKTMPMASGGPSSWRPLISIVPRVIGTSLARHFISVLCRRWGRRR